MYVIGTNWCLRDRSTQRGSDSLIASHSDLLRHFRLLCIQTQVTHSLNIAELTSIAIRVCCSLAAIFRRVLQEGKSTHRIVGVLDSFFFHCHVRRGVVASNSNTISDLCLFKTETPRGSFQVAECTSVSIRISRSPARFFRRILKES